MIRGITSLDARPWQRIHCQILKIIHMGLMTHGPCPIKVSGVVVKSHWYVGVVFWFRGKAMVNSHQGIHTLPCILNILKY